MNAKKVNAGNASAKRSSAKPSARSNAKSNDAQRSSAKKDNVKQSSAQSSARSNAKPNNAQRSSVKKTNVKQASARSSADNASAKRASAQQGAQPTAQPDAAKKIINLREQLQAHNYRYYHLDDPQIPDAEYDRLMRELESLEREHPQYASADSPTQTVGAAPDKTFSQVIHSAPMRSLGNAFDDDEVIAFDRRVRKQLGLAEDESDDESGEVPSEVTYRVTRRVMSRVMHRLASRLARRLTMSPRLNWMAWRLHCDSKMVGCGWRRRAAMGRVVKTLRKTFARCCAGRRG